MRQLTSDILLLSIFTLLFIATTSAQDAHYTDYRAISTFYNPASTGSFAGNYKLSGGIRTQYQRIFEHYSLNGEINLRSPLSKNHWIGLGLSILTDLNGSLKLKTIGGGPNFAYHISTGKKLKTNYALGVGMSRFTIALDPLKYRSEMTILGMTDPDRNKADKSNENALSFHAGMSMDKQVDKKNNLQLGISLMHLNQPNFTILNSKVGAFIGRRTNFNIGWSSQITPTFNLMPAVFFSWSDRQSNFNMQAFSEWKLDKKNTWSGITGVSYRWGESFDLSVGYKSSKTYISLSFDILAGPIRKHISNPGAVEITAAQIFNKDYKPKIKPELFCPRLK
jgi:type IX secretion system PorP/SprF family membrane protein